MKILFTFPLREDLKEELLDEFAGHEFLFTERGVKLGKDLEDADVLVTYGEDLDEEDIHRAGKLKWIMVTSAGVEKMPLPAIAHKRILMTNARGIHKIPMAEFTMSFLFQHAKQSKQLWEQERQGVWNRKAAFKEIYEETILVVGAGAIGTQIAKLARAFGMKTAGVNSSGNAVEGFDAIYSMDRLLEGLKDADYVVSVLPSTPSTKHVYKKEHFQNMKETAVFINIGRGDAVKEEVLLEALRNKEIDHAYLDVFKTEPLQEDHPFWTMDNVTVTPHISSISSKYLPRSMEIFRANLHTFINNGDQYVNIIDPERGY
ncbi:MAG TPA: D-2-hydroxyacid dehydrogenase [Bacillaceae bacterium]